MNKKHAYLIIAHNEFTLLKMLIEMIDSEKNDIFLHIDKKVENFDEKFFAGCTKKSKLYFIQNRVDVKWGDFSQIECELRLLECAVAGKYSYYHLLSGVDLPIKPIEEIYNYFESCGKKEFVHFDSDMLQECFYYRVNKYHLFVNRNNNLWQKVTNRIFMCCQFSIDRMKKSGVVYQKGANWFSITDELANYVIQKRKWIEKLFKKTLCGDEMFLQTVVINSPFKDNLYSYKYNDYTMIARLIDWDRGCPYVYRNEDYDELMQSDKMFARKFSYDTDSKIVLRLYDKIKGNDNLKI